MFVLVQKLKEVLFSVLPIVLIVVILHFTVAPVETPQLIRFFLGALLIIIGLAIFLFGVDIGITPIGRLMGKTVTKTNQLWMIGLGALILGFFVSIAEPDLHVLARQVDLITTGQISFYTLVVVVSVGIALFLAIGFLRILLNIPLYKILIVSYGVVFLLAIFTSKEFFAISFDASGATTGALTVPFILAMATSVSAVKRDTHSMEQDSFGLVAITSIGAIISVMVMSILNRSRSLDGSTAMLINQYDSILYPFIHKFPKFTIEIALALLPIFIAFLVFHFFSFKLPRRQFKKIIKGLLYTFIGLVLLMVGINAGFMEIGSMVGFRIASMDSKFYIVMVGFILGLVTILAEPAVHILTDQIENITSGFIKKRIVLIALSTGVALAVALSMIRIVSQGIQLWHFIVPGYILAIVLTYLVPKLFIGIAFDAGGVASGPMTATFILAFAQGASRAIEGANVLTDGFGVIAMVALTPLITLQILGFLFKKVLSRGGNN
ncbi:MAG: DUF1538 domain-containing protein [Caldisericia bacterium]|nr:DUF1538 domain-containing protein [Caldisericia bacterium]